MKKLYLQPELELIKLATEEILNGSVDKDDTIFEDASDLFG